MLWLGDFRQRDNVGPSAHHRRKIVHSALLKRVDPYRDHSPRLPPRRVEIRGKRVRYGAQCRRRKILELLDQDIGAAGGGASQQVLIRAFQKQPGATEQGWTDFTHESRIPGRNAGRLRQAY